MPTVTSWFTFAFQFRFFSTLFSALAKIMRSFPISGFNSIKKKLADPKRTHKVTRNRTMIFDFGAPLNMYNCRQKKWECLCTNFFLNGSVQMKKTEIKRKTTERKVKNEYRKNELLTTKQWSCDVQVLWKCNKHQSGTENWNIAIWKKKQNEPNFQTMTIVCTNRISTNRWRKKNVFFFSKTHQLLYIKQLVKLVKETH